jgi:hypothetical protein
MAARRRGVGGGKSARAGERPRSFGAGGRERRGGLVVGSGRARWRGARGRAIRSEKARVCLRFRFFFCFFSLFPLSTFFPLDEMGERKGLGEVEYEVKRGLAPALERKNKINGVILIGWPLGDGGGRDKPSPSTSSDGFGIGCRFAFALLCLVGRFG